MRCDTSGQTERDRLCSEHIERGMLHSAHAEQERLLTRSAQTD